MADGFLGRWSRRKLDTQRGRPQAPQPVPPAVPAAGAPVAGPEPKSGAAAIGAGNAVDPVAGASGPAPGQGNPANAPTLDDVKALTAESDFTAFTGRNVDPKVSNAAMKKLFADPHYNVMDRMDVYIDDYSKPDPIPAAMLRQLVSAKFLGLFDAEEQQEAAQQAIEKGARQARDVAYNPTTQTVAKSEPIFKAEALPPDHADPDLRLQPDHAPAGKDPGRGSQ